MKLADKTAVITGAASGIGRAIARSLAKRGCHLVLSDIDERGLAETRSLIDGVRVTTHRLDVSDAAAIAAFPAVVKQTSPHIDLLVNNAGVAVGGTFEQVSEVDFDWLISINFFGVVRMTRAFLPMLHASSAARIVNLSSVFGIIAPPGQTAYAASKFAVRGFSEALRRELESTTVGVSVVHPGGVATSIARSARNPKGPVGEAVAAEARRFDKLLRLPPEKAGETIARGIENDRARILVGNDAVIISVLERLAPVRYWDLMKPGAQKVSQS